MKQLTPSQENYLEWIYRLATQGEVRIGDLVKKLGVSEPSASRAVAGLMKIGLVDHPTYGAVDLTEEGRLAGEAIVRRDECLTRLLVDLLDMDQEEADPEVHRLEHVLGEEVLKRLEILLDFTCSSEAWLKRLHHRIRTSEPVSGKEQKGYRIGETTIHAGKSKER